MSTEPIDEKAVFNIARRIDTREARADYLKQVCGTGSEVLARVVALLEVHDQEQSFLEHPAVARTIDMPPDPSIAAAHVTVIGPYKLLQQIGEGGMGVVYMAEQAAPVRRKVALKIIKPGMDSREVIARFEAERQALALMDHPNIACVFDGGATESGRPYFVMELVRGVPITDYCDQNNLPVHERLELFVTICHAVQHAHQKGIIHRDIKPSNVLVTLHDGRPVPKVIDFGVAKAIGQQLTDKTLFTQFAQMVGTPLYMSPEQAELTGLDIDTRGDIYSLGVLLYELLTGTTPIEGARMKKAAFDEVRRMIREEEPPSPSMRLSSTAGAAQTAVAAHRKVDPRGLSRLVRGDLDWIVMKALEKDRNRRYETANGFAADIGRYLSDEPVLACPPSSVYRFRKFARRNKAGFAIASTVAVALVIAVVGLLISNALVRRESAAKELALEGKSKALAEKVKALGEKNSALNEKEEALQTARFQEGLAKQNAATAEEQREKAAQNEKEAKAQERLARRRFYAAQMNLAQQAWESGQIGRVLELLEDQRPRPDRGNEDFRSFEWYYLWRLCHKGHRLTLRPHGGPITSVVFSPDGSTLATGAQDGSVTLWDARTGQKQLTLARYGVEVKSVAFSPNGRLLASTSWDLKLKLWNVASGQELATIATGGGADNVAFSPDGTILASGGVGPIKLWDVESRKELTRLNHPDNTVVKGLAYSPNGHELAAVYDSHTMKIWDLATGRDRLTVSGGMWASVAFASDGATVASGGFDKLVTLWDPATGKERRTLRGHKDIVTSVAFSTDGRMFASGSHDRSVILWDLTTAEQRTFGHMAAVRSVAFSPDGTSLASGSVDGSVKLWDLTTRDERATSIVTKANAGVAFSADDRALATSSEDGTTNLWDVATGQLRFKLDGWNGRTLAFSPDRTTLASLSSYLTVGLWNVCTGAKLATLEGQPLKADRAGIRSVAFSTDGVTLASASEDGTVTLWDLSTRKPRASINAHPNAWVTCVAFSPDGKTFATASNDYSIKLWDAVTGQERAEGVHGNSVYSVAFSPDSATLASGSLDGSVKLWDVATGQERMAITSHAGTIGMVSFLPDSKAVAARTGDGSVKLWDLATGQERATFRHSAHLQLGSGMAFSHDEKMLATNGDDGMVALWAAATESEVLAQSSVLDYREEAAFNKHFEAIQSFTQTGDLRVDERAYHQAAELFLKLAADYPHLAEYRWNVSSVHADLGKILARRGEQDEAVTVLKKAIEFDPQNAAAHHVLGIALLRQGKVDEGIASCKKAIELDPKDALAHFNLGIALNDQGKPEEAVACFRQAIQFDPKYAPAHSNLGNALAKQGDFDEAIACYRQVVELDPKSSPAHNILATALKDQGKLDEAVACYRRAIELNPVDWDQFVDSFQTTGRIAEDEKIFGQLIAIYQKLAQAESTSSRLTQELALLLVSAGRVTDTLAVWEKLVDKFCCNDDYRLRLGHTLWERADQSSTAGRNDEAEKTLHRALDVFEKLASDFPGNPFYRVEQGFSQWKLGWLMTSLSRPQGAEEPFRQAVAIYKQLATDDPKDRFHGLRLSQSYRQLADVLVRQGKDIDAAVEWGKAAAGYTTAIALNPNDWEGWFGRGFVHVGQQQWDAAIADFSKAIELDPKVHTNWWHRGHCYLALKKWDKAADDFGKIVDQWPDGAEGWYLRGVAWAPFDQPDKAVDDLRQAITRGFNNVEWIKNDPKLDPLRTREDFRKLLKELVK